MVAASPPSLDKPRISYLAWPGPALATAIPGTACTIACALLIPSPSRSLPVIAVMLIGVFCTVDSRFSAVTTIFYNWSLADPTVAAADRVAAGRQSTAAVAETRTCRRTGIFRHLHLVIDLPHVRATRDE